MSGLIVYAVKSYLSASKQFRDTIHAELKGVHPSIELYLSIDEINTQIWQSIPQIQTAVSNFKHFLPFFIRRWFEIAAQNYYKTARETYWQRTHDFSKSMSHIKTENPKEKLYRAVKNLLKFAK